MQVVQPRVVKLSTRTEIDVRRSLPHARLRRIGAWVFLDHFGPTVQVDGMKVAAHPHTGLQTVTWPFQGEVDHRDSIGSAQILHPGELNLMTAGHGVAHSEVSLSGSKMLHAAQLWLALPNEKRGMPPAFEHHAGLPKSLIGDADITLFIGTYAEMTSPATTYSPLVGAEVKLPAGGSVSLDLNRGFEHGILVVSGEVTVNGEPLLLHELAYLEVGTESAEVVASSDTVLLFIGGEPLSEEIFIWWNFIGRSHEEIVQMREEWNSRSSRFGEVQDTLGGWIPAPELPNVRLKAR